MHAVAVTRIVSAQDAEEMAAVLRANREFLAPSDARRDHGYFTAAGQRAALERALEAYSREAMVPLAIIEGDGRLVGRVNINTIVRGGLPVGGHRLLGEPGQQWPRARDCRCGGRHWHRVR